MTAFETAWQLLKAILPDLPFSEDELGAKQRRSYGGYSNEGDRTYEMGVSPDVARKLVEARRNWMEVNNDEYFANTLPRIQGLPKLTREFSHNPGLFEFPSNVLSRIGARHQGSHVPLNTFELAMLNNDGGEGVAPIDAYINSKGDDGWVTVGAGTISPNEGQIDEIMVNPGFGGQGFGQHIMGAMLQDHGMIGDNVYSQSGKRAFQSLGHKLTSGGDINAYRVSPNSPKQVLETVLGDFNFTQPYTGWREPDSDELSGAVIPPNEYTDEQRIEPPRPYPYEYTKLTNQSYTDINGGYEFEPVHEKLQNTFPLGIKYTGEKGAPAVTNTIFKPLTFKE
jgi:hypothetical protein